MTHDNGERTSPLDKLKRTGRRVALGAGGVATAVAMAGCTVHVVDASDIRRPAATATADKTPTPSTTTKTAEKPRQLSPEEARNRELNGELLALCIGAQRDLGEAIIDGITSEKLPRSDVNAKYKKPGEAIYYSYFGVPSPELGPGAVGEYSFTVTVATDKSGHPTKTVKSLTIATVQKRGERRDRMSVYSLTGDEKKCDIDVQTGPDVTDITFTADPEAAKDPRGLVPSNFTAITRGANDVLIAGMHRDPLTGNEYQG